MNKNDLITSMAEKAGLTKAQSKNALDAFMSSTSEALKRGDRISLVGFGSFTTVERKARKGHNPKTKQVINIPAKKVIKFKAGSGLSNLK